MKTFWFALSLGLLLTYTAPAYAYIDPGSGGLVIQMLVAGVIAVFYRFRNGLRKTIAYIRSWFGRKPG